jgi:hypothetical protein
MVLLVAAWAWFSPSGSGEYAPSPDGRYRATAGTYSRGTVFHGRVSYVEVEVVEVAAGKTVWNARRYVLPGETPPEFGDRSKSLVQWAPNSQSVAVPVGGAVDSVWIVP